jgi:hypothetical protein
MLRFCSGFCWRNLNYTSTAYTSSCTYQQPARTTRDPLNVSLIHYLFSPRTYTNKFIYAYECNYMNKIGYNLIWFIPLCVCVYIYIYTVDPRTSNGLMFEQLETRTKNSKKIRFWNSNKNSKVEQRITWSSRGRLLSLLGPDERRVIHLPLNSNIPPTIIIDYYTIFLCMYYYK